MDMTIAGGIENLPVKRCYEFRMCKVSAALCVYFSFLLSLPVPYDNEAQRRHYYFCYGSLGRLG
jgi:hypothetical protein